MYNSKLITLLKTFDKNDWVEVSLHVRHFLGKTARENVLFDYIKKYKHNLSSYKLKTEAVRDFVSPGSTMNSFYNIQSRLIKCIEQFLVMNDLSRRENQFVYGCILVRMYQKRGLDKISITETISLKKRAEKSPVTDMWRDLYLTRSYYNQFLPGIANESTSEKNILKLILASFGDFADQFGLFCLTEKINISNFKGTSWTMEMPSFLKNCGKDPVTGSAKLLHLTYKAVQYKKEEDYLKLKSEFDNQKDLLSVDIYFFVFIQLLNLSMHLGVQGMPEYGRDTLVFYDTGLRSGVLLENKKLSEKRFLNIIGLATKLGEWNWANKFRKDWSGIIETDHYEEVITISRAYEAFAQKKYSQVLELLQISAYKKVDLSLRARWLTLCSLYETYEDDNEDKTYQHISNFRFYLRRNKKDMSGATRKGSENLIKAVELMVKYEPREKVKDFVMNCKFLIFRSWIEKKIE